MRPRDGYQPTEAEALAVVAAFSAYDPSGRPFADQYKKFQDALNTAAPPDAQGIKVFATIHYSASIITDSGTVVLESAQKHAATATGLDSLSRIIVDNGCAGGCDDGNPCTDDSCSSVGGALVCDHAPNANPCDDGNRCTTGDTCTNGTCVGTTDLNTCHFQCYEIKPEPFAGPLVSLKDQFGLVTGVPVQRPERLCAPARIEVAPDRGGRLTTDLGGPRGGSDKTRLRFDAREK